MIRIAIAISSLFLTTIDTQIVWFTNGWTPGPTANDNPLVSIGSGMGISYYDNGSYFDIQREALTGDCSAAQASNVLTCTTLTGIVDGSDAPTGKIGEYLESVLSRSSAITLSSGTPANVVSLSLPAGDWDVSATSMLTGGLLTGVSFVSGYSLTSATMPSQSAGNGDSRIETPTLSTANIDSSLQMPIKRFNVTSTTTVFLVAEVTLTVGTGKAYGKISARRIH